MTNEAAPAVAVTILGSIGSGKTTLARGLSRATGWCEYLEAPSANPFLDRMRTAPKDFCFRNQLWYVVEALSSLERAWTTGGIIDHSLEEVVGVHSPLFAKYGWLDPDHMHALRLAAESEASERWARRVFIVLHAEPEDLMDRVVTRGRRADVVPTAGYLVDVQARRAEVVEALDGHVIHVDSSSADVREPAIIERVLRLIEAVV